MNWQSRDVCAVLEDVEKCYETRNFAVLPGLIHELKILASRIENVEDLANSQERLTESVARLVKKRDKLRSEVGGDD